MICFKCGGEVADSARFCGHCGAQVTDPHSATVLVEDSSPEEQLSRMRRIFAGEYGIAMELGRGGMGVIYKATEEGSGRTLALKVLAPELSVSGRISERFRREARMVAELEHPNIVPIYRVGQLGGVLFIAMKYIDGRTLDSIVESQGPLPIPVVLHVLRTAACGLAHAHERGIVHRDIKGGNLLVDRRGQVMLTDFGVALRSSDVALTQDGTVIGTPAFMSPEQCVGKRAEPQSDQYSLGMVAFQMLAGKVPYEADTIAGYIHHHLRTPPPDIRSVRDDIPPALVQIIERTIAKHPSERFPSTADMRAAIEEIPFSDAERRSSEAMLQRLALGDAVDPVRTRSFIPVREGELATLVVARPSRARPPYWRRWPVAAALGVIALGAVAIATGFDGPAAPPVAAATATDSLPAAPPQPVSAPSGTPEPAAPPPGALRVLTSPPTARILVDGVPVGGLGSAFDVPIAAGERRLQVRASGYRAFDTTITVPARGLVNLRRVELRPLGQTAGEGP